MKRLSLNGIWQMNGGGYSCKGTVPGSVYSFLLDEKLIPDPYYRTNELDALRILDNDFEFSRSFDYTVPADGSRVMLRCEGLDTLADIYINGGHVAYTDNMHRSYEFDVTSLLCSGENRICVLFHSPNRYIKEKYKEDPVPGNSDTLVGFCHIRKASCMMGWDWGPRLPDAGIWKSISLLAVDSDRITEVHVTQRHENGKVFVTPAVRTERGTAEITVTVTAPDGDTFTVPANTETEIPSPMLWWPRGFGKAHLYNIKVELFENGAVVDENTKRIGLRQMELVREKDEYGESFYHRVNGVGIFAMGADYIPEDNLLSRVTKERTEKLLRHCADCNFNAIRIWGGGFYPHDFFFDACDELGLMVFADMMFACMNVPGNKEMIENVAAEVRENLTRIRHHACLAVISGNNEMEAGITWWGEARRAELSEVYLKVFEDVLPKIAAEVCPYLPYVPSSPSSFGSFRDPDNENYGDSHYWAVWHSNLPFTEYRNHYFRYLSEFGFESFPCEKTVNSFTEPRERNIFSRTMEMHQRCKGANKKILMYLADTFLYPSDFGTMLYASQLLQAEAMRYCVEHLRRNRGRCMGALYWQLNDIWPVASWSGIDYYGRFKALQYMAKRFYAPVMISAEEIGETATRPFVIMEADYYDYSTEARLCVSNETTSPIFGTVSWELRSSDGSILRSGAEDVTVPALGALQLPNMDFEKTDVMNNYLSYSFVSGGNVISSGTTLFTVPKHFLFKDPHLTYERNGDEITVYADAYARCVEIDSPDSDFILSDNYFDMNGGKVTVKILEGEPKTIRLRSVYDIR